MQTLINMLQFRQGIFFMLYSFTNDQIRNGARFDVENQLGYVLFDSQD